MLSILNTPILIEEQNDITLDTVVCMETWVM